jgi:hypothetical protein
MADVHELSYQEVADTVKVPLGTVMSRELADVAKEYGILRRKEAERYKVSQMRHHYSFKVLDANLRQRGEWQICVEASNLGYISFALALW